MVILSSHKRAEQCIFLRSLQQCVPGDTNFKCQFLQSYEQYSTVPVGTVL
jgi:hypothetical protein